MAAKMAASTVVQRNLPYFRQQLFAAFQTCSVAVKFICAMVFLFYLLSFSVPAFRAISCTPGYIIPPNFWVWTAFSHCFMENTLWMVLTDVITVGLCGKLIEPLWGALEMLTFFAIVNTSVAFLSVMYYIVVYTISSDPYYLFSIHIHGLAGYCAGVAVAVKQIMPDHMLLNFTFGRLRNRNVPLCVFLLSLFLWVVGLLRSTYPVMFAAGLITSWVYLRFYQHHSNGTKGDMAENFTFASFFPNVMQPPIAVVSNMLFDVLVKAKLCSRPVRLYNMAASASSITVNLPGTEPQDAERRRQIALRALTERLNKVDLQQSPWPSMVDDPESPPSKHEKHVTISIPIAGPSQPQTTPQDGSIVAATTTATHHGSSPTT